MTPSSPVKKLIRFGPHGDGGYLIPDDLDGIEACFSPGVDRISGFELDSANRGIPVYLADKSVDTPPDSHEQFHFTKKYVGSFDSEDFMTIETWVNESLESKESDLLMQIDIEGFEYETFLAMPQYLLKRFRIIVVEFHELDQLWSKSFFSIASRVFEKLGKHHSIVHLHPNNYFPVITKNGISIPPLLEITYVRKDCCIPGDRPLEIPHPLDSDNVPDRASVLLPAMWYNKKALEELI